MKRKRKRIKIPYDELIYLFFSLIPGFYELNHPASELSCKCRGKSLVIKRDNWGTHFFCCQCFMIWIMPVNGLPYQKKDYTKHCQHAKKAAHA